MFTAAEKEKLLERVRSLAANWENYVFSDTARWDRLVSGKIDIDDVRQVLTEARRIAFAARGSLVVEGRRGNRGLLSVVFRIGDDEKLYIAKLIG